MAAPKFDFDPIGSSFACLAEILLFDNISEASTIGYSCMWIEVACPSDVPESPRFRVRSASTGRYTEYGQFQNPSPLSQPYPEAMEAMTRTRMYVLKKEKTNTALLDQESIFVSPFAIVSDD